MEGDWKRSEEGRQREKRKGMGKEEREGGEDKEGIVKGGIEERKMRKKEG